MSSRYSVAAPLLAASIVLPVFLPIPAFRAVPILAQTVSVAAVFLVLPPAIGADAARYLRGSRLRLLVLAMCVAATAAWIGGVLAHGLKASSAVSLLNWLALAALVVCGQLVFRTPARLRWLIEGWATVYAVAATLVVGYLFALFGADIFTSTNRGPFQSAARAIFPTWPNYFGIVLGACICVSFGRLLTGRNSGAWSWWRLVALLTALLVTFSRSSWLACLAGLAVMTAASGRLRRSLPPLAFASALATVGALQIPAVRYQLIATFSEGTSQRVGLLERLALVVEAYRLWREHPMFGIGFGRFEDHADRSRLAARGFADASVTSVHNEYLTTLLKGGLLVAVTFVMFLLAAVAIFRSAIRMRDSPEVRRYGLVGLGITTVLAVAGLGAESFRAISVSGPFWLLVGAVSVLRETAPAQGAVSLPLSQEALPDGA